MKIIKFALIMYMLLMAGTSSGQEVDSVLRVSIAALQAGSVNHPDYIKAFQLPNSEATIQWALVEKTQGNYDFSAIETGLKKVIGMNRNAIIKLNANDKPEWLFDIVPYTTDILNGAIKNDKGTLMYWHPTYIDAHEKMLIAFGKYLEKTPYRDRIAAVRMSFNALGVEVVDVPSSHWPLEKWIIPAGCDPKTVTAYNANVPLMYKDTIFGYFLKHITPYAYVYARTDTYDQIIDKHKSYFDSGKIGFFHTGAGMEGNQVYDQTHRYSRFIEFCRSGKTFGFTEVDGYHIYKSKYTDSEIFQLTQFNYWYMLSSMHLGISLAGVHDHMFRASLENGGPVLNLFDVPEMNEGWKFADKYLGLHASPNESPGAWVALRDDIGDNYKGDYTFLMEREGNNPIAPLVDAYPGVNDGSVGKRKVGSELVRFGAWARGLPSGKTMTFHVDPRVFSDGEKRIARVVYFDQGVGTWQLKQNGAVKLTVTNENTGNWIEKEVLIETNGNDYQIVNIGSEEVIFHMLEVKRDSISSVSQSSYSGVPQTIPGLIEVEYYDVGGEGVAYHDDDIKEGDINFRPEDNVDVVAKAMASNDSVVSYTNDGEWLDYTVDVTAGNFDITLYYFCGETPGDLAVSLDGNVLDTITGLQNHGWEIRDSITAENIFLGNGGKKRFLRLEFVNGAGFDIDAVKFTKQFTPVNGVTLTDCPSDPLFVGNTGQLMAIVSPYYADDLTVTWSSSDESVATVDSSGMVTSISAGTAKITVTTNEGGFTDTCEIISMIEVISVYGLTIANCPTTILQTGDTHQLVANVAPADATDKSVTWSSSNPEVATIDDNGLIHAISQGAAQISVTTNDGGYKKTCNIGVMSTGISVTSIAITGCTADVLKVDSTYQLIANVTPANAGDLRVNWISSDETVATVDENGWIAPLSSGATTIIATTNDGGYTEECNINVDINVNTKKMGGTGQFVEVFPNPVSDILNFRFSETGSKKKISFYNMQGQLLFTETTFCKELVIDISKFNSEVTLIAKVISDGTVTSLKIITKK